MKCGDSTHFKWTFGEPIITCKLVETPGEIAKEWGVSDEGTKYSLLGTHLRSLVADEVFLQRRANDKPSSC